VQQYSGKILNLCEFTHVLAA